MNTVNEFKPMLASKTPKTDSEWVKLWDLGWPKLLSPKLDGIRATVLGDGIYSRTLKPIRNAFAQSIFVRPELDGLDGELIAGDPYGPDVFNRSTSAVMTIGCTTQVTFHVFDLVDPSGSIPYDVRLEMIHKRLAALPGGVLRHIQVVPQIPVYDISAFHNISEDHVKQGYEGSIVRTPQGLYKFGRSTLREGYLVKIKWFLDDEAEVTGFEPLYSNQNPLIRNGVGDIKRSVAKEGLVEKEMLGALTVKMKDGRVFRVGSGFTAAEREEIWANKEKYLGAFIVYKHMPYGAQELPRTPIFKAFRHIEDI